MNIINFKAENIKRISVVEITPRSNTVVIGGQNGQGKSSVLDAIMYALAGAHCIPEKPIKENEKNGYVTLNIGDYIITRNFHRKNDGTVGSTLEIKNAEGFTASSPQKLLDGFCGKMTFDPLEFSRLKPKDQVDQLKKLVNIDFSELDKERSCLYEERTFVNRDIKKIEALLSDDFYNPNLPDKEISISDLMNNLSRVQKQNEENRKFKENVNFLKNNILNKNIQLTNLKEEVKKLQEKIGEISLVICALQDTLNINEIAMENLIDEDDFKIKEQIEKSEQINLKISKNKSFQMHEKAKNDLIIQSQELTKNICEIDDKKKRIMGEANFPVCGLGFDENGVIFNGFSFEQSSSAEKLKVSVAMGISLNPKLKIMQIRDGSLLDENSLKIIDEMADKSGMQIWIERVGEGSECSVIISDGHVK